MAQLLARICLRANVDAQISTRKYRRANLDAHLSVAQKSDAQVSVRICESAKVVTKAIVTEEQCNGVIGIDKLAFLDDISVSET